MELELIKAWLTDVVGCSFVETPDRPKIDAAKLPNTLLSDFKRFQAGTKHQFFKGKSFDQVLETVKINAFGYRLKDDQMFFVFTSDEQTLSYDNLSKAQLIESFLSAAFYWYISHWREDQLPPQFYFMLPSADLHYEQEGFINELYFIQNTLERVLRCDLSFQILTNKKFFDFIYSPLLDLNNTEQEALLKSTAVQIKTYIDSAEQNEPFLEKYNESAQINKLRTKLPYWFDSNFSAASRILFAYLEIEERSTEVTFYELKRRAQVGNFDIHFEKMCDGSITNHAKVFDLSNDKKVNLWPKIESKVTSAFAEYKQGKEKKLSFEEEVWYLSGLGLDDFLNDDDTEPVLQALKDRLYKYKDHGLLEEKSLSLEDNLLIQFYKLAIISNYKYINSKEPKEFPPHLNEEGLPPNLLQSSPHLYHIKAIVEEYRGDWEFYSKDRDIARFLDVISSGDLKGKSGRFIESIERRVIGTSIPAYENLWRTKDLYDYTIDCYDRAVEMAAASHIAFRAGYTSLAWCALSKSREFLGIYQGARVELDKKFKYRTGYFSQERYVEFVRERFVQKIYALTKKQCQLNDSGKPFDPRLFNLKSGIDESDLEGSLISELSKELIPIAKEISNVFHFDTKKFNLSEKEDLVDEYVNLINGWSKTDQPFKEAFHLLWLAVTKPKSDELIDYFKHKAKEEVSPENEFVCFSKPIWLELKVFLSNQFGGQAFYRHGNCAKGNDCPMKKVEDSRREEFLEFINSSLKI